ncbi:hypothetical protein DV515_00008546 [Chloebia gouldiae]|uniref:Mastermind-like 1/3 transactivation domain-containing protein n=1 Tax=Chloebia gouldiae TaxID=44316 RepID=A0A3L8SFG3_CHLGU|nr:hypothetical protein DV515_00008546 [Chloebia gouldiae]
MRGYSAASASITVRARLEQPPTKGSSRVEDGLPSGSALQETVKRKLEGARSPLNGEQQNGVCDGNFSPTSKRTCKDVPGIEAINSFPINLPLPAVSPLQQLDMKAPLLLQNSRTHRSGLEDLGENGGLSEIKLPVNGCNELDDSFNILHSKELKQEPLDDSNCIDTSETSLSNQNKLFSDINLNDQEWQELIDELANTVPEDDIQDLFNEDFEEKKEPEFPRPATETQESASVKSDPSHSPFAHVPLGSPQVRPSSSGPPFSNISSGSSIISASSAPLAPVPAGSPANCVVQSPQTPSQSHTPGQTQVHSGNGFLMNQTSAVAGSGPGPVTLPSADLSPAEQLKQMAAQQQQRAKLMQQKQQQHPHQPSSWSPGGPPSSPYGGPFSADKPNSPMMYSQAFTNENPIVPPMANNSPKTTINNYLPQNHINRISHQPNNLVTNSLGKQPNMLSYGNTKPLTHFNTELNQMMTPAMANPGKNTMVPYIQQQQQSQQMQMPAQVAHLSEEQKCMLIMKQKGMMNQPMAYTTLPALGQVSGECTTHGQQEADTKALYNRPLVSANTEADTSLLAGNGTGFCGGQIRRAGDIMSQPREQGKLQASSPHVPITSYQCKGEMGSFVNGGIHGNPFPTAPSGSPAHLIKLLKKTLNVVREESRGISTLMRLYGGCQNHLSEEAVPTSEVLQPIKDYTVTASFWVAL